MSECAYADALAVQKICEECPMSKNPVDPFTGFMCKEIRKGMTPSWHNLGVCQLLALRKASK